ncbi:MAG TPA: hypothetical protein DCE41_02675, partial [Cytophagales bacterium]|nr:hypothetical protein [Cytophagales bacterium]
TEERMEELERDLADETSELQKAELHLAELKNELGGDWQGVTLEEFQALLTERGEALKQVLNTQTKMETLRDLEGILVGMENVLLEGKGLSQQIKEVYQGDNIRTHANQLRQTHQAAHHQLQEAEQGKARWRKELEVTLANREAIGQSLVAPLKALGYEHPSEALTALVDPAQYADWKRQESSLKQTLAGQKERKDLLEKQLKEQPLDILKADLDSLEGEKTRAQAEVVLQQEQRDQLRAQKVTQDRVRDELSNMEEKISQQRAANQKWVLLKQYIGDAEGKVFSTFAQDLTLQHLVGLANRRLSTLSPRYRLAMPTQGSDDSLAVLDQDMGQMRRSVKTLSGGESFLISLSLALGLSDLASREVDIKSLFIDEGFGTLDPETLDLTLDTLERLQAEGGKTIGVISHVEALKERIGTQIVVTPNGQGYSTLRIR